MNFEGQTVLMEDRNWQRQFNIMPLVTSASFLHCLYTACVLPEKSQGRESETALHLYMLKKTGNIFFTWLINISDLIKFCLSLQLNGQIL